MVDSTLQHIEDSGVVAVLRGVDPESVVDVATAIVDGGVTAVEVTADAREAPGMIEQLDGVFGNDVLVGAGTVLDEETARTVQLAGAEFVVTPTLDEGVIETCNRYGTLVAPGVFTPTEAQRAYEAGADVIKVFPAKTGGPGHVSALKGPLGHLEVIPTGGVGPGNAGDYIDAGATAVGAGGSIVDDEAIEAGDFEAIEENARLLVEAVESARSD